MPPLIPETVAWLRFYSPVPLPPLPGESAPPAAPDPARTAPGAPIAGAVIGAVAGLAVVAAAFLGAADFVAAAAGVLMLVALTGGRAEHALAALADRRAVALDPAANVLRYGIVAVTLAVLLRAGALDALLLHGVWGTAFALIGACAFARAAAVGFTLLRPAAAEGGAPAERGALQWLGIAALVLGVATVLPFFGIGAALAGIAAAAGAVALVSAFLPAGAGAARDFLAIAELAAEIAFLLAVLAFAAA